VEAGGVRSDPRPTSGRPGPSGPGSGRAPPERAGSRDPDGVPRARAGADAGRRTARRPCTGRAELPRGASRVRSDTAGRADHRLRSEPSGTEAFSAPALSENEVGRDRSDRGIAARESLARGDPSTRPVLL
jgi:hypothetical protein